MDIFDRNCGNCGSDKSLCINCVDYSGNCNNGTICLQNWSEKVDEDNVRTQNGT